MIEQVEIDMFGLCRDCKHYHPIHTVNPRQFASEVRQWEQKHDGHNFEFMTVKRRIPKGFDDRQYEKEGRAPWWLDYKPNADLKIAYAASAAITISLGSLASSSTWVAGRESALQDNSTNKYVAGIITARIKTGTSPTADTQIRVYAYQVLNDTPTYPSGLAGSDAAATITNTQMLDALPLLGGIIVSSTSNVAYDMPRLQSLEEAFGVHPWKWGIYVTHNTAVALNATGGDHVITYKGAYFTSI